MKKEIEPGASRNPKFGEWMRGIYASKNNPIRDGMYVRTIRRQGRLNKGVPYQLTDGEGKFWEYPRESTIFLSEEEK